MPEGEIPFPDRPLVYLAGPYSHPDPIANTRATIVAAERLLHDGNVTPFVPHLTALWHFVEPHDLEFWYEYDLSVLARCDAVFRLQGESTGADREVAFAQERGIPVFEKAASLAAWAEMFTR